MRIKVLFGWGLVGLCLPGIAISAQTLRTQSSRVVESADVMQWGMGLMLVLALFFTLAWALRKLNGLSIGGPDKLRVVGGLSLGVREKVVLLEVGKKQLLLGVTPGRIETLLVLDEADCLNREVGDPTRAESVFAQKLMQVMTRRSDA